MKEFYTTYREFDIRYKILNYHSYRKSPDKYSPDDPEEIEVTAQAILTKDGKIVDTFDLSNEQIKKLGIEAEALEEVARQRQQDRIERSLSLEGAIDDIIAPVNRMLARKLFI